MTTFKVEEFHIDGADLGGEDSLPPIAGIKNVQQVMESELSEDDGLFIGYGFLDGSFPYKSQNLYERELKPKTMKSVVLENQYLRAVFLPEMGGRLWSLVDKEKNQELTFSNPVMRPGNLAIRNAWVAGGVEWNFGLVGHHPYTCSPVFAAKLRDKNGTPVLRIYEYERIRSCTWQIDFFLPEDSRVLLCRTRIVNPGRTVVPVYWWSNIAVPAVEKGRIIVAADECYTNKEGVVYKRDVVGDQTESDITYPHNSPYAVDYFWKIHENKRPYVCQLDQNGYGLVQCSTKRLQGRKLFLWGQGIGGENWQEFLSGKGCLGQYAEIQAGLAKTQYECVPMPPHTAWEWLEAYGAMNADGKKVHGEWQEARQAVEDQLNAMIDLETMEHILVETKEDIGLKPAEEIIVAGSGWGALENLRREKAGQPMVSGHLDFGQVTSEQEDWQHLLESGSMPERNPKITPKSYMWQSEWTDMLRMALEGKDQENWYSYYQLGVIHVAERDIERGEELFRLSLEKKENPWAYYGLAQISLQRNVHALAVECIIKVWEIGVQDESLAKECSRVLLSSGEYEKLANFIHSLPETIQNKGRIQMNLAIAYFHLGKYQEAEEILHRNGGLIVPDMREGEVSITDLWMKLEEVKGNIANPPKQFDFRMNPS